MPRKKLSNQQHPSEDVVVELVCEWGDICEKPFPLKDFSEFKAHVEQHIRDLLPGYSNQHSEDSIPEDFTCPWIECGWDSPEDTDELLRHLLFHAFHTKLKANGNMKQIKTKMNLCGLDSQGRNLVPDIPEPFLCEWEDCNLEFNCPHWFYQHVESHVMAVDKKEGWEEDDHGSAKTCVVCQWNGCSTKVRNHYKLKEHCHTHTREKVYACSVCGGMFASMSKFTDHLSRQNTSEFETFQCSHCLKHCGSQRILRDHMRHHVNNIKCEFCDMTCPNPSALKQHIKFRHSTDRPHECDVCEYSCKTYSDLRRHRESHNAVFSYQCAVEGCDFTARAMQTLKRHFKVQHEGGDLAKYECHLCGCRYTRGTGLTHHLKVKHKFRWPAGHPRFRYKEHEDGILRLQTVRFESLKLSQELNDKGTDQSPEDFQYVRSDSPQSVEDELSSERGDEFDQHNGEVDIEGSSDNLDEEDEDTTLQSNEAQLPQETVQGSGNEGFQYLLLQYEEHEQQIQKNQTGHVEDSQARQGLQPIELRVDLQGPVRKEQPSVRSHPYERPSSPVSTLDVPRTLLALQQAAMRLANRQEL